MKLYEITELYLENEQDKTDDELYQDTKETIMLELKDKSTNIIKLIQNLEGDISKVKNEIQRLNDIKDYHENKIENIKKMVTRAMQEMDLKKVETPLGKVSLRKSESLIVENKKDIPSKFITIKQTEIINKTDIKNAIKNGEDVKGVSIKVNQNLQIK